MGNTCVGKGTPEPEWFLIDASGQNRGLLATEIARGLMGKHKPTFTPGAYLRDIVVGINGRHLAIAPKRLDTKNYYAHSNFPGGLRTVGMRDQMRTYPDRVIRAAVWGMLPHNNWGRRLMKRLRIFAEAEHTHQAQSPKPVA